MNNERFKIIYGDYWLHTKRTLYRTTRCFFGIANSLRELIPQMKAFWKEAEGRIHIDAWREVSMVDDCAVTITVKAHGEAAS